ncbi:MAG TPA: hypothetical protein VGS22_14775 [Thermoanaerobaculia bacterium]|jgi:hypothetical protein|nr:hypothetical protein [Thermoanaerobaculia bacterium]
MSKRSALIVALLGFALARSSAASFLLNRVAPMACAESVALTVRVDSSGFPAVDVTEADSLERRLSATAVRRLGESRIVLDSAGRDLHLEILARPDGDVLIALYSRAGAERNTAWIEGWGHALTRYLPAASRNHPKLLERAALELLDQAIASRTSPDCEPIRAFSARHGCAFEIPPSDPEAQSRYLRARRDAGGPDNLDSWPSASLFALGAEGDERLLATFPLTDLNLPERFLVTDDGRFVVAFDLRPMRNPDAPRDVTTIYRGDGSVVARLALEDLLNPAEIEANLRLGGYFNPMSAELDDDHDRLILTPLVGLAPREIVVDLESGRVVTSVR